jgi:hypothetical protein
MKKFFILLATAMTFAFISCERPADVDTPLTPTIGDTIPIVEEQSPIKGVWKSQQNGLQMTLEYGERNVKFTYYLEYYNATAIYEGTYTITDNEITHEFTSLTKKNSSKIEYYSPEKMPKEAVLQDANTIIYMDNSYKRQ